MATLYFNAAVDDDWSELGNWWTDSSHTVQATSLPTSSDSVVVSVDIYTNSGSEPTVVDLTVNPEVQQGVIGIPVTVTGMATFNGGSALYDYATGSQITGNATFNDASSCAGGWIIGNATLNDNSFLEDYSFVSGNADFNDNSFKRGYSSSVAGTTTFRGSAYNKSGLDGDVIVAYEKGINGSSILGVV